MPTNVPLQAAAALLQLDVSTGPESPVHPVRTATGGLGLPGHHGQKMVVPTSGIPVADAKDYASLLQFMATTGQTPGSGAGQLPPGYLPMTAGNGVGTLAAYTMAAADRRGGAERAGAVLGTHRRTNEFGHRPRRCRCARRPVRHVLCADPRPGGPCAVCPRHHRHQPEPPAHPVGLEHRPTGAVVGHRPDDHGVPILLILERRALRRAGGARDLAAGPPPPAMVIAGTLAPVEELVAAPPGEDTAPRAARREAAHRCRDRS